MESGFSEPRSSLLEYSGFTYSPYGSLEEIEAHGSDAERCKALWYAVIEWAWYDVLDPKDFDRRPWYRTSEKVMNQQLAIAWFRSKDKKHFNSFESLCAVLGLSAEKIRKKLREVLRHEK